MIRINISNGYLLMGTQIEFLIHYKVYLLYKQRVTKYIIFTQ